MFENLARKKALATWRDKIARFEWLTGCPALAGSVNTSASFVRRTIAKLSKAGLIVTATGKNGACRLARRPRDISLLEIYRAVDAPKAFAIHHYAVQRQCPVSCRIKDALGKVLGKTQTAFENSLSKSSLADIVAEIKT
jgi:Rrf2 family protein